MVEEDAVSTPRVSIGMPVYNGAEFLAEALDSWLAQDCGDFELICCDNASTDDTPRILADYAKRDPRIRVITRPQTVIAWENYNGLVPEARAPVFTWTACDDLREPGFLRLLLKGLDDHPDAVLAYGLTRLFGDPRREQRHTTTIDDTPGEEPTALGRTIAMLRSRQWYVIYGLIRTDVLRKTRLFVHPMGFNADVGLCLELATHGPLHAVREVLLHFRLHPKSLSVNPDDPINAVRGRHFDAGARAFADGLPLPPLEKRIFTRQLEVWCRKAEKPRRHVWKWSAFRSAYVRVAHGMIDVSRAVNRV
jgi:GT2 family glycosyltransferase